MLPHLRQIYKIYVLFANAARFFGKKKVLFAAFAANVHLVRSVYKRDGFNTTIISRRQ